MHGGVAHHPAFADLLGAGLELGLDQRHQLGLLGGERERRREHGCQPDKACVAGDQVDRLGDRDARQVARIDALVDDHPWILAQLPGELAAPDIDGMDPGGAVRQQHVGKSPGRRADVERGRALDIDREVIERERQLDPATRDPGVVAAGERERGFLGERRAGLVDPPSVS